MQEWAAEARKREAEEAECKQIRELERQVKREARLQVTLPAPRTECPSRFFRCVYFLLIRHTCLSACLS